MVRRYTKLRNSLKRRRNLWDDSESDASSKSDEEEFRQMSTVETIMTDSNSETASDETSESRERTRCFICLLIPNLSSLNSCSEHLTLLTTPVLNSSCSYSSSSAKSRHRLGRRSMILESSSSSDEDDSFITPDGQSHDTTDNYLLYRSLGVQTQSLPLSPVESSVSNGCYTHRLESSIIQNDDQRTINQVTPLQVNSNRDTENTSDINPALVDSSNVSRRARSAIRKNIMMRHLDQERSQPVILLERIPIDRWNKI